MAKPPDLRDMLRGSMSPVPTSKLVTSLQPKAGPSRASQVFFRPPTPKLASDSNNDMDAANIADADPMITIPTVPTSTPIPPPQTALQSWKESMGMPSWRILMTQLHLWSQGQGLSRSSGMPVCSLAIGLLNSRPLLRWLYRNQANHRMTLPSHFAQLFF
jgi:hypothetical protein